MKRSTDMEQTQPFDDDLGMTRHAKRLSLVWQDRGHILEYRSRPICKGVYLLVHKGLENRIIYVGQSAEGEGIARRVDHFVAEVLRGRKTVWRPEGGSDIYDLMSERDNDWYLHLVRTGRLWIADDGMKVELTREDFDQKWKAYVVHEYLRQLRVWCCEIDDSKNLESQIQYALCKYWSIGYYNSRSTFLGRLSVNASLRRSVCFQFGNIPNVDRETQRILADLFACQ